MATTAVYDSSQVTIIAGVTPIMGLSRDAGVKISYESAQYSTITDNRGNSIRSKLNNSNAIIEINLNQDSDSNNLFSNYLEADKQNNAGTFPMFIKDCNGTSLFVSASAYISEIPEVTFSTEANIITWKITATNMSRFIGGLNK